MNILYIHGLSSSGESRTARTLRKLLPEDNIISPDLPIDPEEALDLLHRIVEEEKIDLAIGTSMGGMLAQNLHGPYKILINPACHVSQMMRTIIGEQSFLNPRKDGAEHFKITPELCDKYERIEEGLLRHTSLNSDENSKAYLDKETYALFGVDDNVVNCKEECQKLYTFCHSITCGHRLSEDDIENLLPIINHFRYRYLNLPSNSTEVTPIEFIEGIRDEYGGVYSADERRFLGYEGKGAYYQVKTGTEIICDWAFGQPNSLGLKEIVLPDSITEIGKSAFNFKLKKCEIPLSVKKIGERAFDNCQQLSITIPESVVSIDGNPFIRCASVECKSENFRIDNNVLFTADGRKLIGVFKPCDEYEIPSSVTSVSNYAFLDINHIIIPSHVKKIGQHVFDALFHCQSITIENPTLKISPIDHMIHDSFFSGRSPLIRVPKGTLDRYKDIFRGFNRFCEI